MTAADILGESTNEFQKVYAELINAAGNINDSSNPIYVNDIGASDTSRTNMEGGGKVSVGTASTVEVTFTGTTTSILISADTANTGKVFIGKSTVTNAGANSIAFLEAGESLTIDYNDSTNAVYVISDTASQNFYKGALL